MFIQWLSSIFIESILTSDFTLRNKKGDKSFCNSAFLSKNKRQKVRLQQAIWKLCTSQQWAQINFPLGNKCYMIYHQSHLSEEKRIQPTKHPHLGGHYWFQDCKKARGTSEVHNQNPPSTFSPLFLGQKAKLKSISTRHADKTCIRKEATWRFFSC